MREEGIAMVIDMPRHDRRSSTGQKGAAIYWPKCVISLDGLKMANIN